MTTLNPTYSEVLVETLRRFPARVAFESGDRSVTFAEVASTVSQFQQVLAAKNIRRFAAVAALSPNVPEVWMLQASAYLNGARYTGLHPLGSPDDHALICADAQIDLLVVHEKYAHIGAEIIERTAVREVLVIGKSDLGEDLLRLAGRYTPSRLSAGPAEREDIAWLPYTGGTTGRPKGVMVSQRAMAQEVMSASSWGVPDAPRYVVASPITHAGSLPVLPTLYRGGSVILQQGFDPDEYLRAIQDRGANYGFIVPTMLYALLDHQDAASYDTSNLRTLIYGSAPSAPARIAEAVDRFGPVLLQGYGQTESLGMATALGKDEHDPVNGFDALASCGRPVLGVRVAVLDEDCNEVPDGEVGELCLRSDVMMSGYWKQPEASETALRGGWLHTTDLGRRDENGLYYLVDRKKDLVITGGFNVYPREVEDAIAELPDVAGVAVVGLPDPKWGEAVTAFVVARPGAHLDAETVKAHVKSRKGAHQAPKHVRTVDELPTTALGKIDKKALRALFPQGLQ